MKLTRRELLALAGGTALMGTNKLWAADEESGSSGPKMLCKPAISGTLWWLNEDSTSWDVSAWRDELDQQHKIGFDLLWLCNVPNALELPGDPVKQILDLCAKRKVRVILDTGSSAKWWDPFEPKAEIEKCGKDIKRIAERFAGHPAFKYWYVPHEIYLAQDTFAANIDILYPGLVECCKNAADLPVSVSPFFVLDSEKLFGGGFLPNEPDDYERYWAHVIKKSGFDIVMLQDSGEHFSFCTNDRRRPYFKAMQSACKSAGAKLWGNVECAEVECPSADEYLKRYGKVHMQTVPGLPWRPVPVDRLKSKLELAAEYAEDTVTWGYREFCRPGTGDVAKKWYEEYLGYTKGISSKSTLV